MTFNCSSAAAGMQFEQPAKLWRAAFFGAGIGALAASLMATTAYAQTAPSEGGLETVVVTAQKRSEDAQKVPISMTVLTAADLTARGVNDFRQLEEFVPNVTFSGVDTSIEPTIAIRGISSDTRNIGFESGVSMYIDGVYTGTPSSFNLDMLDVDQIEVLRGPQGTLFGKNTTAGAINIITHTPTDESEGSAELQYGNYNQVVARASYSGALVDNTLFGEVGGFYRYHDGFQDNLYDDRKYYGENGGGAQTKLRYTPTSTFDITVALDGLADHYRPDVNSLIPGQLGYVPGQNPRDANINTNVWQEREDVGGSIIVNDQLGGGYTLSSLTAARIVDTHFVSDDDETPNNWLISNFDDRESHFSQELRIVSPSTDRFSYVAGLFFYDQAEDTNRHSEVPPNTIAGPDGVLVTLNGNVDTQSYAAYGQADYKLTDALTLTGGIRYTYETKNMQMALVGSPAFNILSLDAKESQTDSNVSPMVNLSYAFNDNVNAYAKISEGFKSGGFNLDYVSSDQLQFRPETVTNYEAGLKTQVDNVRFNAAAFYMDYNNLQVDTYEALRGFVISNAATAHIWGVELDGVAELFPGFELDGGLGYLNATFSSYPNGGGLGLNYTGNQLQDAPHWTGNIAAQYNHEVAGWGNLYVRGEYAYRDDFYVNASNASNSHIPGYGLLNGRLGLTSDDGRWTYEVWGKNLLNKLYTDDSGMAAFTQFVSYGAPRTYGIRIATKFQ